MELYLKSLNIELDRTFKPKHNHETLFNNIYDQLRTVIGKNGLQQQKLTNFIEIITKYYNNFIGGQKLFKNPDTENMNFRYLQKESYVYEKN